MGKDLFENEQKQTMTRERAAAYLRDLADQLARQNEVRVEHGGRDVTVTVADEVRVEVELEVKQSGRSELEVTLTW